jgi:transcription-repair coupling factor (superfamily II helicase)
VRGGILDVFSPEAAKPVRIDLFGDQVESMRRFDVESQRSVLKVEDCTLLPLTEYQKSRGLLAGTGRTDAEANIPGRDLPPPGEPFPGWELLVPMVRPRDGSVFSLLDRPLVVWDEPRKVQAPPSVLEAAGADTAIAGLRSRTGSSSAGRIWNARPRPPHPFAGGTGDRLGRPAEEAGTLHIPPGPRWPSTATCRWPSPRRAPGGSGNRVAFFAFHGEVERVADILNEYGVPYQLGLEQFDSTPAYLAERAYMAGSNASIYLVKGLVGGAPLSRIRIL